MSALAAAAIASTLIGGYKVYEGEHQKAKGRKIAENNIFSPEQMPGQVKLATNLAGQNYYNGMPGTATAQQLIKQSGANNIYNGVQGASSGGDILDLASKINYGQNIATNDLTYKAAEYKARALGDYETALNNEGNWEDKLYHNNVLDPYMRKANTASALEGAGNINEFSGLDQIGTAGISYLNGKEPKQWDTIGEKKGIADLQDPAYATVPQVNPPLMQQPINGFPNIQSSVPSTVPFFPTLTPWNPGLQTKKRGY